MKASEKFLILFLTLITLSASCGIIMAVANHEPYVNPPPKHYPIVRCPACHLVKQPPNPCPGLTGWEWEECTDIAHRYPDD